MNIDIKYADPKCGIGLYELIQHCWVHAMPISFALQQMRDLGYARPFDKRYVEVTYHHLNVDHDTFYNVGEPYYNKFGMPFAEEYRNV